LKREKKKKQVKGGPWDGTGKEDVGNREKGGRPGPSRKKNKNLKSKRVGGGVMGENYTARRKQGSNVPVRPLLVLYIGKKWD